MKKSLFVLIAMPIIGLIGLAGFNYYVDPFMAFHKSYLEPTVYFHDERTSRPGLVRKTQTHNVVLGPSSMGFFLANYLENYYGSKSTQLTMGGSTLFEQRLILESALETNPVKNVLWGIELQSVSRGKMETEYADFPYYLYGNRKGLITKYLFNYKILHVSLKAMEARQLNQDTSLFVFDLDKRLDRITISERYSFNNFYKNIKNYFSKEIENDHKANYSKKNIKENIFHNIEKTVRIHKNIQFDIITPPHSYFEILYIYLFNRDIYEAFSYLLNEIQKLSQYDNVNVYYFHEKSDFIFEVNEFSDLRHFSHNLSKKVFKKLKKNKNQYREYRKIKELSQEILKKCYNDEIINVPVDLVQEPESILKCVNLMVGS